MILRIQKKQSKFMSCGLSKISNVIITIENEDGKVGIITGDELKEQLNLFGFDIIDKKMSVDESGKIK